MTDVSADIRRGGRDFFARGTDTAGRETGGDKLFTYRLAILREMNSG